MKRIIILVIISFAFSQRSKIGISANNIISSPNYDSGYTGLGIYFQRTIGYVDFGLNFNYATYLEKSINNIDDNPINYSLVEFHFFSKLRIQLSNKLLTGFGIGVGSNSLGFIYIEDNIYKSISVNISYETVNRATGPARAFFRNKTPTYKGLRTTLFISFN